MYGAGAVMVAYIKPIGGVSMVDNQGNRAENQDFEWGDW